MAVFTPFRPCAARRAFSRRTRAASSSATTWAEAQYLEALEASARLYRAKLRGGPDASADVERSEQWLRGWGAGHPGRMTQLTLMGFPRAFVERHLS